MAAPSRDVKAALQKASDAQQYSSILHGMILSANRSDDSRSANLIAYSDSLLSSSLGVISVRSLLASVIQALASDSPDVRVTVGAHLAIALQSQTASFEEQDAILRETLATGYAAQEDYSTAARTLQSINLETTQRQVSDESKVRLWIKVVRYFLEDDDTVLAESALNKIKNLPSSSEIFSSSPDLKLHYQLSQARILDSRRKFLEASAEYLGVSLSPSVAEEDRLQALSAAIKTAILAPAGPLRSRTLGKLYKDERSQETEEYRILEKMCLDRLLEAKEVDAFAASLQPHQLAQTADGNTVLSKAVIEHNLLAVSKLYDNISTAALGSILALQDGKDGTAAEKAEEYAARMVEQRRLKGGIDQIDGVIIFDTLEGVKAGSAGSERRHWDHGVLGLIEDVEKCAAAVTESFPDLLGEQMVH